MNQTRLGARIRLQAARRVYGGRSAGVGPLDLALEPGAFCAVVGPSGCGKSTLLRLLAGLETCSDGVVETDATAPGDVAMVFQSPTLLPWLSARDNVDLPLRLLHRADPAAADAALARVGLADATRLKP
ncbi:MAG: ATP-binding cassette domain-containing protein, partial [Alphaproteobacteria bacterium]|nr:ATP-binding cassette domain-containing protein [Alphaproteobacteria bacterium]